MAIFRKLERYQLNLNCLPAQFETLLNGAT
jgi:hypothetical protein